MALHCPFPHQNQPAVQCSFCGNTVTVPWHIDPPRIQPAFRPGPPPASPNRLLAIIILAFVGVGLFIALIINSQHAIRSSPPIQPLPGPFKPVGKPSPKPGGFGKSVLRFGGEGIGPGLFKDARSVAIDGDGHIYVGEYGERRVQVFDAAGKFITQWMVRPEMAVGKLVADRKGNVYIESGGTIYRFEGATGKELGHLDYPGGANFNDVVTTPDGGLVASEFTFSDQIVRFDPAGKTTLVIRKAVSSQSDRPEPMLHIAVDGLGNIYAMSTFANTVYKFTVDGKYVSRFGGEGDEPGQFRMPASIAVDGQGRVYVSDFRGIQVFDPTGRYIGLIKGGEVASGMVFDDSNALFVATAITW